MKTAAEYRGLAEECFKWAREAQDDEVRVSYLQLAQVWLNAASKLDGLSPTRTKSARPFAARQKKWTHDNVDRRWSLRNQGQDMYLLASPRHFRSLVIVPLLAAILAFPASAQTSSDPNSTSTAGAQAQSEPTGGPTSSNPASPKTGSNTATPSTKTDSTAAKAESKPGGAPPESNPGTKKAGSAVLININKAKQEVTVFLDGIEKYHWPVSTGRAGYSTPTGTYTATSMNEIWYSKQWDNSPMPHSIFFMKDGHAIHGSYEVKNLGRPVSHGCVRISPENATTLYALVKGNGLENTQVVLTGVTPGGEFKFARGQAGFGWADQAGFGWGSGPCPKLST
jgi:lipoprotein-anchoring transpeptidase ErfK/SrfK